MSLGLTPTKSEVDAMAGNIAANLNYLFDNIALFKAWLDAKTVGGVTAVTAAYCRITGTITVNAGGTLTVQFAQNASDVTASSVLIGSTFIVQQMA